jgi:hypothetical protein
VTGQEPSDLDQVVTDSVFRNNYRDVSAFADLPEKPLWFFIDSLEQISQLADQSDPGKPQYRVSTNSTPIGLLAGFEVSRVDYSLVTQNRTPMPEMHRGALVLMNIWPGLYKLVAAYSGSDAPDSSAIVYLGDLECLGNFWYDDDRREIDWAQYWTWDWPTEAPKNLRFAQAASNALDSALPIGYYARYAGLMVNDSLSLTAPVYRPTDDFGKPTGGEVTIRFGVEENLLHVLSCVYRAPKK